MLVVVGALHERCDPTTGLTGHVDMWFTFRTNAAHHIGNRKIRKSNKNSSEFSIFFREKLTISGKTLLRHKIFYTVDDAYSYNFHSTDTDNTRARNTDSSLSPTARIVLSTKCRGDLQKTTSYSIILRLDPRYLVRVISPSQIWWRRKNGTLRTFYHVYPRAEKPGILGDVRKKCQKKIYNFPLLRTCNVLWQQPPDTASKRPESLTTPKTSEKN